MNESLHPEMARYIEYLMNAEISKLHMRAKWMRLRIMRESTDHAGTQTSTIDNNIVHMLFPSAL